MRMRRLHRRGNFDLVMARVLRTLGVVALAGGVCLAQVGPPVCAVASGKQVPSLRPAVARPTVAAAVATAEAAAADPTIVVAAEPMENFGVARYRLEDYADCVGTGGCYWADVDTQAQRAGAELARLVAQVEREAGPGAGY